MGRVHGCRPQLSASDQRPSRMAKRLRASAGQKETHMAVGGKQREGVGQVPTDPHFPLASRPRPQPPCRFSEPCRQGPHHPETVSQHGFPNKTGLTAAWMKEKTLLKQPALQHVCCPRTAPASGFSSSRHFLPAQRFGKSGLLPTGALLPPGAG